MSDFVVGLIERYRSSGILVDTNLLLLYFVGSFDPNLISTFKRTTAFTSEDFVLLNRLLREFRRVVTTPNILTEVNSLSNQLPEHIKQRYFPLFARGIMLLEEIYTPSRDIAVRREFVAFGLTDTGIFHSAANEYLILTQDFRLSQVLAARGIDVINFNHLRGYLFS